MYFGINSEVILQAYFLLFWRICGNPLQKMHLSSQPSYEEPQFYLCILYVHTQRISLTGSY